MARRWATVCLGMWLATVCGYAADQDEQPNLTPRSSHSWADLIKEVTETPDEAEGHGEEEEDSPGADETSGNAEATRLYHEAAEQGDADAQYSLGAMYAVGEVVPQDYAQAEHWYRRAAEQGHSESQYKLGLMYDMGQGVSQDSAEAEHWYRLAAEQNHSSAKTLLARLIADQGGSSSLQHEEPAEEERPAQAAPDVEFANSTVVSLDDEDCYKEIASIDYGGWTEDLEENRFRYVFQHISDYPYYRRVEGVFVGVETRRESPQEIRSGFKYWRMVDGRRGVGAEGHYSLVPDLLGSTVVNGHPVDVTADNEFAFFLYDREDDVRNFYYASAAPKGLLDVLTTTEGAPGFIETGELRPWSPRFYRNASTIRSGYQYEERTIFSNRPRRVSVVRYGDREWDDNILEEKTFRSLFFIDSVSTVAGVEHEVTKVCRLEYSPLVVTNSVALVPAIERELARRGERMHAARIAKGEVPAAVEESRSAFNRLAPDTFVRVIAVPSDHVGDFEATSDLFGDVRITFTQDPYSDQIYYTAEKKFVYYVLRETGLYNFFVRGRLSVGGRDLGVPVIGYLGRFRRCCSEDTKSLKNQSFEMRWTPQDGLRVKCGSGKCEIFAQKKELRLR